MDLIRSCYTTDMRLYTDSDQTTAVRWFFADENAKLFPGPTRFNSLNWSSDHWRADGPGEVMGAIRTYSRGEPARFQTGQRFCGTLDQFRDGASINDRRFPLSIFGAAPCCTLTAGGLVLGGRSKFKRLEKFAGGLEFGGASRFARRFPSKGGLSFDGKSRFARRIVSHGGLEVGGYTRFPKFISHGGLALGGLSILRRKNESIGGLKLGGSSKLRRKIHFPGGVKFGGASRFSSVGGGCGGFSHIDVFRDLVGSNFTRSIVAGPDGNLWATVELGQRLVQVTPAGIYTDWPNPGAVRLFDLVVGPDNHLWVTEASAIAGDIGVWQFRLDTFTWHWFPLTPLPIGGSTSQFGICVVPGGRLAVTDFAGMRIRIINTAGTLLGTIDLTGPAWNPYQIITGPDNELWWTAQGVGGFGVHNTTTAGVVNFFIPLSGIANDLCNGPDGNVWVMTTANIYKITQTPVVTQFAGAGSDSLSGGCSPGPDGNVWYVIPSADFIGRITPAGIRTTWFLPGFRSGLDVCIGPDGNMWGTDTIGALTFPEVFRFCMH
jgi:streptogramin lyase